MSLAGISLRIICSIILSACNVYTEDISGLLSRLYRSAAQNNRPLVLIIDRSGQTERPKHPLIPSDLIQTSDEKGNQDIPAVFLIKSHVPHPQNPKAPYEIAKDRDQLLNRYKHKTRLQKFKGHQGKLRIFGSTPSPVIKTLLRYKNEMNCEANNECQIECKIRFSGKKKDTCENKCEAKFECEPEEEYQDPCENQSDECEDNKNPSTRGVKLVTEKPQCVRC
ncbi:uncharacterized protein [Battus philenor]|uniref:uncharacterized protein n=1 Tax=Battus philenor TaxID=42288 RepID=UPI0035D0E11B